MPAGIFDNSSGTIWNHDNGYANPSATENANQNNFGQNILDPTGLVSGLWNDVMGFTSQSREFSQQEYLQDKMNAYNTPAAQMARMKAAGINPNLAASGIAGSGSESAQAPAVSSNTGGVSAGVGAIASMLGGGASAALVSAQKNNLESQSRNFDAETNRTDTLLDYEVGKFKAETAKTWIDAGMDKHMADYWSAKAAYATKQEQMDLMGKFWSIRKCKQDILNLKEDRKIKMKQLDIMKETLSQEQYHTQQMEIETNFAKERWRIYNERGIDVNQSEDGMLVEAEANGHGDFLMDALKKRSDAITAGALDATRKQLREQLQIEYAEKLEYYKKQLLEDKNFREELIKMGVRADVMEGVLNLVFRRLPGASGTSVKLGPVGVSSEPASIK